MKKTALQKLGLQELNKAAQAATNGGAHERNSAATVVVITGTYGAFYGATKRR